MRFIVLALTVLAASFASAQGGTPDAVACARNCPASDVTCVSNCIGTNPAQLQSFATCASACAGTDVACINTCSRTHLGFDPETGAITNPTPGTTTPSPTPSPSGANKSEPAKNETTSAAGRVVMVGSTVILASVVGAASLF